jgi:hypothetical protein
MVERHRPAAALARPENVVRHAELRREVHSPAVRASALVE